MIASVGRVPHRKICRELSGVSDDAVGAGAWRPEFERGRTGKREAIPVDGMLKADMRAAEIAPATVVQQAALSHGPLSDNGMAGRQHGAAHLPRVTGTRCVRCSGFGKAAYASQ